MAELGYVMGKDLERRGEKMFVLIFCELIISWSRLKYCVPLSSRLLWY